MTTQRPEWVIPGAPVVLVQHGAWSGGPTVTDTTIARVTKRDIVLETGARYRFDRASYAQDPMLVVYDPPRSGDAYSRVDRPKMMHPDNPQVARLRARAERERQLTSTKLALRSAYDALVKSDAPTVDMATRVAVTADLYVRARGGVSL